MRALNATARKQAEGQRLGPLPLLASLPPPTQDWSLPRSAYLTSVGLSLASYLCPGLQLLSCLCLRFPDPPPWGSHPICVPFKPPRAPVA